MQRYWLLKQMVISLPWCMATRLWNILHIIHLSDQLQADSKNQGEDEFGANVSCSVFHYFKTIATAKA
jgi:hypothetical protein